MFEWVRVAGSGGGAGAVLTGVFADKEAGPDQSPVFDDPAVAAALARRECTGEPDNLVEAFTADGGRVLLIGLGQREKFAPDALRKAAARAGRRLAQTKDETVRLDFAPLVSGAGLNLQEAGRALGEGFGLLAWDPARFRGSGSEAKERTPLTLVAEDSALRAGVEFGLGIADAANLARDLSQTPPNMATPLWMAEQAQKLADETGLTCRVIQGAELEAERLNGLINVGRASAHPPCLIRLEYHPAPIQNPKSKLQNPSPVVLIGKTVTYDTGGLSLKPREAMVGMKRDKDGGCAVLGAMRAVATLLKPDFPVVALLPAAENCVGDQAMRPDDVITYRNGVTVEVTNTDAEGRLVLADALCWACEVEKPRLIVDLATLTGGVVIALGSTYAGLFCDDDGLRGRLDAASAHSGERVWRLPLHAEYRDLMKSPVADIQNSNANRRAHPIQGAAFLTYFVTEGVPWAHIDIAGVHSTDADSGPYVKGPTGWGVCLLADLIAGL